jgi:hypothetical protein
LKARCCRRPCGAAALSGASLVLPGAGGVSLLKPGVFARYGRSAETPASNQHP